MARECSVCYGEDGSFVKLSCGHEFCAGCIKSWYLKGTGTGCPMCRRPVYFKGFHKVREQWNQDAWDTRCTEVFGEAVDACLTESLEMAEMFPRKYRKQILADALEDLADIEKTYRFLRHEDLDDESIAYVLLETADYYSDRHLVRPWTSAEPIKTLPPRYPMWSARPTLAARSRALMDPWSTVNLVIEF